MASTYTPLGVELQATGENAGTWGTKTNTNLQIIEQISGGYTTQAVSDSGDTDLSVSDGSTGATLSHRVIEFTGSLTASRNVTIPTDVQNFYFLKNATSGSQNVVFKYATGTGTSATVANGKTVIAYAKADDGTPEKSIEPTLEQLSENLRKGSRSGANVKIKIRKLEKISDGISKPVVIGEVQKNVKMNLSLKNEN